MIISETFLIKKRIISTNQLNLNDMGYTHYYVRTRKNTQQEWNQFVDVCKTLRRNLPKRTTTAGGYHSNDLIKIVGWDGQGRANFNKKFISFNGKDDLRHESFYMSNNEKKWKFCKTARKPYDLLVVAVILAAYQILDYRFGSDGFCNNGDVSDLMDGVEFYNNTIKPKNKITDKMLWEQREEYKKLRNL